MKKQLLILLVLVALMVGCKKNVLEVTSDPASTPVLKNSNSKHSLTANDWTSNPYKLNVIYFVPNDVDTVTNYRARLSRILFDYQEFIATNMDREGFGRKSFGLEVLGNGLVDISTIMAPSGKANYTSANSVNIETVVNSYFTANPSKKRSLHNLIITPRYDQDLNNSANNPFYGQGKNCFAIDYAQMDVSYLGQNTFYGNKATQYIGGLNHELGHGLGLPHNKQTVSAGALYGTSLMGIGNGTYGKSPTFLTSASCAILSANQILSTSTRSTWYTTPVFGFKNYKAEVVSNNLIISGRITSGTLPISQITAYHDPTPYGPNLDYDAPSFKGTVFGTDSFRVVCPLADFYDKTHETQMRLNVIFEDGYVATKSLVYNFNASVPVINPVVITSGNNYKLFSQLINTSVLDIVGSSTVSGTKVQIWANGTPNVTSQIWKFTALGNNYYRISPTNAPNLALSVPGNVSTVGTQIQVNTYTGATGQQWKIQPQMDGFSLAPSCAPEAVLKIVGAITTNGTKLELAAVTSSNSWVWKALTP